MSSSAIAQPIRCAHCGSGQITYKKKAGLWQCEDCERQFPGTAPGVISRRLSDQAERPMHIFFSYGHDANKELVQLFQQALERRGHKIWIDFKEIGTWDDWRGGITRGIDASQLAIAFLSRHAIRDPGVCRNEIAIALNRFGVVYPVLLESGVEQDIPVTIRALQWPDLSQWRDIRDGNVPGMVWERWYEEKLFNLIEKLEGEASTLADETRILRAALQPSSFESKITQHLPEFIGREWVFEAYQHWLEEQPDSRLFWIKGGPGVGKSAIVANLAHRERSAIVASWFCDAKSGELKNPNYALRSIAFQLALRWEDYRVKLMRQLQLDVTADEDVLDQLKRNLGQKDTQDLFRYLLSEPLTNLIWREHKLVIVIDALDEGLDHAGNNRITELIAQEMSSLPNWIGFVVTSRPEADVVNRLQGFKGFELDALDPRNQSDLRAWYQANLGQRSELAALPPAQQQAIETLLIDRSAGMILYLKAIEEGFREASLAVNQLQHLESGLPGLYRRYYDSFQQRFGRHFEIEAKPLLRLLLAAEGPLPEDLAREVLGWDREQFEARRNRLGSYVIETGTGYELFHKTLGEWLNNRSSTPFYVDRQQGRLLISDVLFEELSKKTAYQARWRKCILEWLPEWIAELPEYADPRPFEILSTVLARLGNYSPVPMLVDHALAMRRKALPSGHSDLRGHIRIMANLLCNIGCYAEAELLYCELIGFPDAPPPAADKEAAMDFNNLASLLRLTGRLKEAEMFSRVAAEIEAKILPSQHPDRATGLSHLASILFAKGNHDEAEPLFREALAIRRAILSKEDPDLAHGLNNLGILLKTTGRYDEAEPLLREALAIRKSVLQPYDPLIVESLNNLASVLYVVKRYEETEALLREALSLRNAWLPAGHPDIGDSVIRLAGLLKEMGRHADVKRLLAGNSD